MVIVAVVGGGDGVAIVNHDGDNAAVGGDSVIFCGSIAVVAVCCCGGSAAIAGGDGVTVVSGDSGRVAIGMIAWLS